MLSRDFFYFKSIKHRLTNIEIIVYLHSSTFEFQLNMPETPSIFDRCRIINIIVYIQWQIWSRNVFILNTNSNQLQFQLFWECIMV